MALRFATKAITSALKSFQPVAIPSATMAITSANSYCGYNICHSQKISFKCGFSSSTNKQKSGYYICHNGKNISHDTSIWQITSANNIQQLQINCDNNICYIQHPKKLAKHIQKKHYYGKHANILQKIPTKITKNNIPHTPTKVGVMVRKTFSHTPDEAMSGGLAKACDL